MSQEKVRVVIFVEGGVIQFIDAASFVDTWVIDWDDIASDPIATWKSWNTEQQRYFQESFPEEYAKYIAESHPEVQS